MSKRKPNTPKESTESEVAKTAPAESAAPEAAGSKPAGSKPAGSKPVKSAKETPEASVAQAESTSKARNTRKPSGSPKAEVSGDADPVSARPGRTTAKRSSASKATASGQPSVASDHASVASDQPSVTSDQPIVASGQAAGDFARPAEAAAPEAAAPGKPAPKKSAAQSGSKTIGKKPAAKAKDAPESAKPESAQAETRAVEAQASAATEAQASAATEAAAPPKSERAPAKPKSGRGQGKANNAKPASEGTGAAKTGALPDVEAPKAETPEAETPKAETPAVETAVAEAPKDDSPAHAAQTGEEQNPSATPTAAPTAAPTAGETTPTPGRSRNRRGRGGKRKSQAAQAAQTTQTAQAAQSPAESQTAPARTDQPTAEPQQLNGESQQPNDNNGSGRPALPPVKPGGKRWYKVDLHMHTMASNDYEDPQVSWLDWLRTVAERGLEVVAIADHNTVRGVAAIRGEIEWLTKLEAMGRLTDQERADLEMWRELSNRVLVLPGFEFTATFGFHILGIFPPETSVRSLEQLLLKLNVPPEKLDVGSTETGASADVLTAYRVIHEAGGLAIAAHANSTHGVALRDFPFGGQTKIAYTQDPHLDALEVTDLEGRGYSTARFFNGSKTEYPRKMHCIQGSDSHRINTDPRNPKRLGIGERTTEMMLDEASFAAILNVLRSNAFDRTRPTRPKDKPFDAFAKAREEGNTLVQAFHDAALKPGAKFDALLNDICAFANGAGGSIFVGANAGKGRMSGVQRPRQVEEMIQKALGDRLTPQLDLRFDSVQSEGVTVLRIRVPKGDDRPYCLDDYKFYVRDEDETSLAVRDEIIAMVLETMNQRTVEIAPGIESLALTDVTPITDASASAEAATPSAVKSSNRRGKKNGATAPQDTRIAPHDARLTPQDDAFYLPQMGVEIVESETRNGMQYHTIRNLSKGETVRNISRRSAKDLWSYAIRQHETGAVKPGSIKWQGDVGLVHVEKRAGRLRYDLALRENGSTRIFYGVTEDGMEGRWALFVQEEA